MIRAPTAAPRGCDVIPGLREAKSPEPITTAIGKRGSTPAPQVFMGSGLSPPASPGMTAAAMVR
jgi:hypothetical protein